jgi:uncharacterized protein YkwD
MLLMSGCGGGSSDSSSTNSIEQEATQEQSEQENNAAEGDIASEPDKSTPIVLPQTNHQPSATITGIELATSGETVTLDGTDSSDPDGDSLTYNWSQTQGPAVNLGDAANPSLIFIAPSVDQVTTFKFQLQVSDGALSDTAAIVFTIAPMQDTTAPVILTRIPESNATDVSVSTTISVDFSEPMEEALVDNESLILSLNSTPVSASVIYDNQYYRLSLTPDTTLSAETTYTLTLGYNLQDLSGNPVAVESWQFTTGSQYNLGQTSQLTIDTCMSTSDKIMLDLINNARSQSRSCGDTVYPAVNTVAWHCNLDLAAQGHSTSMAQYDYFSHTGLDGSSPGDRISAAGYVWRAYGENIAAGFPDEQSVMDAWLESPGHCVNIMNPIYTEAGVAIDVNPDSVYKIYWTQEFADRM